MEKIEYRVRPVTRYVVTRWHHNDEDRSGGCGMLGEYDSEQLAYEVGCALCRAEHQRLGYPPGDERIKYPEPVLSNTDARNTDAVTAV